MANMGYCRFENTLEDLRDCADHINDNLEDSEDEERARKRLVAMCDQIVGEFMYEV